VWPRCRRDFSRSSSARHAPTRRRRYVEEFEKRQALGQPAEREGAAAETALVLLGAVGVLAALSLAL